MMQRRTFLQSSDVIFTEYNTNDGFTNKVYPRCAGVCLRIQVGVVGIQVGVVGRSILLCPPGLNMPSSPPALPPRELGCHPVNLAGSALHFPPPPCHYMT